MVTSGFSTQHDKNMTINPDLVAKIDELNLAYRDNYKDPENPSDLGYTPDWKIAELLNAANISVAQTSYNVVKTQTVADILSRFLTPGSVSNYLSDIGLAAITSIDPEVRTAAMTAQQFLTIGSEFDFNQASIRDRAGAIITALAGVGLIDPTTANELVALGVNSNPVFISWIENYNNQPENAEQQIESPISSQTVGVARGGILTSFFEG